VRLTSRPNDRTPHEGPAGRPAPPIPFLQTLVFAGFPERKRLALVLFSRQNSHSQLTQIIPELYGPHL